MEKDLSETLRLASVLAEENPCRMSVFTKNALSQALRTMISSEYSKGVNQDKLARYYGVSVRTIQRYQKQFLDFPKPRNLGDGTVFYDPVEIIEWKKKHQEVVGNR